MDKYSRYSILIRHILIFMIGFDLVSRFASTPARLITFVSIFLLIVANDFLRYRGFFAKNGRNGTLSLVSLLGSMIMGFLLVCLAGGNNSIYLFILLYEIVFFTYGSILKLFMALQLSLILGFFLVGMAKEPAALSPAFILKNGLSFVVSAIFLAAYILFLLLVKAQMSEKAKVTQLNKELESSYCKLKDYAERVEELAISKERHRVAQEIHDSLGHSLTAIIMHLDYIENILQRDSAKAKEVVVKTQALARSSMDQVRMAVFALKDSPPNHKGLLPSLKDMIDSIEVTDNISVKSFIDEAAENLSASLQGIIYKTIQEGLTNGINHGQATEFFIKLYLYEETLLLEIKDNGKGCETIVLGNGLLGIEKRVLAVFGKVAFQSSSGEGFAIRICIPIREGCYEKNKAGPCG